LLGGCLLSPWKQHSRKGQGFRQVVPRSGVCQPRCSLDKGTEFRTCPASRDGCDPGKVTLSEPYKFTKKPRTSPDWTGWRVDMMEGLWAAERTLEEGVNWDGSHADVTDACCDASRRWKGDKHGGLGCLGPRPLSERHHAELWRKMPQIAGSLGSAKGKPVTAMDLVSSTTRAVSIEIPQSLGMPGPQGNRKEGRDRTIQPSS
jgi:hypothetical protein